MFAWMAVRDPLLQGEFLPMVRSIFEFFGLSGLSRLLLQTVLMAIAVVFAWGLDWASRRFVVGWIHSFVLRTENRWDDEMMKEHVFERLAHLAPALVLFGSSRLIFPMGSWGRVVVQHISVIMIVLVVVWALDGMVDALLGMLRTMEGMRYKPLESYGQVIKLVLGLVAAVLIISELMGRSPWALLGGLGAFTAVLMLVFRDSILGFVASVQISALDLVREGDWIEMPKYGANGSIVSFSLTTVRVQNWDKTITTIPTYALTADSFKNWRGMFEAGARRIKRSIHLDMTSVCFLDLAMLEKLKKIQILRPYLDAKEAEIATWNQERHIDPSSPVNGRQMTNVGTFRAYLETYLEQHPKIDTRMTFLVHQLEPGPQGLPIEIYVFTREQSWVPYEKLISDIFDHILAILPIFSLRVYQSLHGADVRALLSMAATDTPTPPEDIEI
ncbi:MAG: mechanosensitive ion channel family protein [Myxococcales bacterium]|nr:mechanosensitive ion channel family protein [Myxococcales bacterium]